MFNSLRYAFGMLVAALAVLAMVGTLQAETALLTDNFNNVQPNSYYGSPDYGLNEELPARQSGSLAPIQYVVGKPVPYAVQVNDTANPGVLEIFTDSSVGGGWVAPNHNLPQNITLSAKIVPEVGTQTDTNGWVALGIRGQSADPTAGGSYGFGLGNPAGGAWLVIKPTGAWEYYENGATYSTSGSVAAAASYDVTMATAGASLSTSINGAVIDLNGVDLGTTRTLEGVAATGGNNYVAFQAYQIQGFPESGYSFHTIDNLQITTVPEPSTIMVLPTGLMGLLAYAWRKRS